MPKVKRQHKLTEAESYAIEREQDLQDLIDPDNRSNYTHNRISMLLRSVAAKCGNAVANKMVDEYNLTKEYGIHKIEV